MDFKDFLRSNNFKVGLGERVCVSDWNDKGKTFEAGVDFSGINHLSKEKGQFYVVVDGDTWVDEEAYEISKQLRERWEEYNRVAPKPQIVEAKPQTKQDIQPLTLTIDKLDSLVAIPERLKGDAYIREHNDMIGYHQRDLDAYSKRITKELGYIDVRRMKVLEDLKAKHIEARKLDREALVEEQRILQTKITEINSKLAAFNDGLSEEQVKELSDAEVSFKSEVAELEKKYKDEEKRLNKEIQSHKDRIEGYLEAKKEK